MADPAYFLSSARIRRQPPPLRAGARRTPERGPRTPQPRGAAGARRPGKEKGAQVGSAPPPPPPSVTHGEACPQTCLSPAVWRVQVAAGRGERLLDFISRGRDFVTQQPGLEGSGLRPPLGARARTHAHASRVGPGLLRCQGDCSGQSPADRM